MRLYPPPTWARTQRIGRNTSEPLTPSGSPASAISPTRGSPPLTAGRGVEVATTVRSVAEVAAGATTEGWVEGSTAASSAAGSAAGAATGGEVEVSPAVGAAAEAGTGTTGVEVEASPAAGSAAEAAGGSATGGGVVSPAG